MMIGGIIRVLWHSGHNTLRQDVGSLVVGGLRNFAGAMTFSPGLNSHTASEIMVVAREMRLM